MQRLREVGVVRGGWFLQAVRVVAVDDFEVEGFEADAGEGF